MITEKLLLALQFKKLENLELTIDYENRNETEDRIISGPAYYFQVDEDLYMTIFIREKDVVALLGSHTDSIPETEAFKIKSPSEIFDIMSSYFGLRVNWVDSIVNRDIEKELNAPNLFNTYFCNKESWKLFVRGLAAGYSMSIDLLKDKFRDDFDFDNTFDKITGLSLRDALCQMLLSDAKMEPRQIGNIMMWLKSPQIYEVLESQRKLLKGIIRAVEESVLLPDDQILPSARNNAHREGTDDLPF